MYQASIENSRGSAIQLTGNEPNYQILNIEGLNPPQAQVNLTPMAAMDGAKFNSAKLETRELVITIRINGNAEANRIKLYEYFPTKEEVTFYYSNSSRDVFIKGYVNSCEVNPFSQDEEMQISILCPNPYFKAIEEVVADISNVTAQFDFPFSIENPIPFSSYEMNAESNVYNPADTSTGMLINIEVTGSVRDILIRNTVTGKSIELDYAFEAGDIVTINTNSGEKSIRLLRNGIVSNIFSALVSGSVFLQLASGDNLLAYQVDGGENNQYVYITFEFYSVYRGV